MREVKEEHNHEIQKQYFNFNNIQQKEGYSFTVMISQQCKKCGIVIIKKDNSELYYSEYSNNYNSLTCEEIIIKDIIE